MGRPGRRDGGGGMALGELGLPSSYLFGALLAGIAAALLAPDRFAVRAPAFTGALAVAGVVLGTLLDSLVARRDRRAAGCRWRS